MLNMSNPFYNYIGEQLVSFFAKESKQGKTDRYYLYLPSEQLVSNISNVFQGQENAEAFQYQHEAGARSYDTIALRFGDMKYVIATTNNNTTIDFLVTLRNEMSEQRGQWENTSLIFICNTLNDSIRGGSRDLTNEGLPLHVSQIVGNLDDLVSRSLLTPAEKVVTRHYLKKREFEHRVENSSFLDFEEVLALVNQGKIAVEAYEDMGYFQDPKLEDMVREQETVPYETSKWKTLQREIDRRLDDNTTQHKEVERIRSLGNYKERLEEQFGNGGSKLSDDENWYKESFETIGNWKDQVKSTQKIAFETDKVKADLLLNDQKEPLTVWQRPRSHTAAGRRNLSFIIFHPNYQVGENVELILPFDRRTKTEFLNSTSKKVAVSRGQSIIANVKLEPSGITFMRVVYKHENTSTGNYSFNIAVAACEPSFLDAQSDTFIVKSTPKSARAILFTLDNQELIIGNQRDVIISLKQHNEVIEMDKGGVIRFEPGLLDDTETSLRFTVKTPKLELPVEIKDEMLKTIPINGAKLWELKRNNESSFTVDSEAKRVEIGHLPYATFERDRPFLLMEEEWIKQRVRKASIQMKTLVPETCRLPEEVETAYDAFLQVIENTGTIPSLLYYSENIKEKAQAYIAAFTKAIEGIRNQQVMSNKERELYLLGSARDGNTIYMTPFSPLNVAFQLQINEETAGETIDANILNQLKAVYTLPYLMDSDGDLFKPTTDSHLPEWLAYLPREEVTVGETNNYLAKVVQEKLAQFGDHYDYLFSLDPTAALLLNVINIPNDLEVLRGIVDWLKGQINQNNSLTGLRNIEVIAYKAEMDGPSAFDVLNDIGDAEEIGTRLGIDFAMKDYLAEDVLLAIQQVLRYSKRSIDDPIQYAHISFYKMKNEERDVQQLVKNSPSSLNLNGLFTTVVSTQTENGGYRAGFGTGNSDVLRSPLTHFAVKMNELVANMRNRGQDPYTKDIAFAMQIDTEDEQYLEQLYKQSHWLTFIDPAVDLAYFQDSSKNLVIVHYSDQLSSSNHYDAITVTDKSEQYANVIQDFLKSQQVEVAASEIEDVIRAFNTFNGEWLLRAVQGRSHDKREKMSIVSAIKQALKIFDQENVLWVPVSMEEIVRVTGNVGLSRKGGIFSGKTAGKRGNCSDDILMMGLEQSADGLKVHLYPVEVKIGHNASGVIEKGISQVNELKARLNEQLIETDTFDAKFLRNFFMRIFINNAVKMENNAFWPSRNYKLTAEVIDQLLNDEFEIVNTLAADFGNGLVLSYRKMAGFAVRERRQGVIVVELPEQLGYDTLAKPMDDIEVLTFGTRIAAPTKDVKPEVVYTPEPVEEVEDLPELPTEKTTKIELPEERVVPSKANESTEVRPLIGLTNSEPIHWEFDHNSLSNRHLVIGGRSGQGKTYFIQSLLLDLAKSGQSAVVIDYSSSYTRKQLEPIFIEEMGDKLQERIVYHEGFPLNPFILRQKEVAGIVALEKPTEAARRVVDVFASVYRSFGAQQKSALYDATKRGIEMYGGKMKMEHLLEVLEDLDGYAKTVISSISSRLVQLVDIDPFDYEAEDQWEKYFAPGGKITIIQLAGYDQDEIKRLMAEFILWDLWYYTQDGTKDKAVPVILDEAQNLDFSDGSPAAKILREGRKFGWSAWFATQTFNNFSKEELSIIDNAGTKVYFNPAESELRVIAGRIGDASPEELRMLQKGQCLVMGQFMQGDGALGNPTYHVVTVPPIGTY